MKEDLQMDKKSGDDHGKDEVIITVDGIEKKIHRGSYTVAEIKHLTGVPEADKLAPVIDGQLKPTLNDDDRITIKGGEIFRIVPGGGTSS